MYAFSPKIYWISHKNRKRNKNIMFLCSMKVWVPQNKMTTVFVTTFCIYDFLLMPKSVRTRTVIQPNLLIKPPCHVYLYQTWNNTQTGFWSRYTVYEHQTCSMSTMSQYRYICSVSSCKYEYHTCSMSAISWVLVLVYSLVVIMSTLLVV